MRVVVIAAAVAWAGIAGAQEAAKPAGLTAEQVIERTIQASGGREAMEKLTSTVAKGTADISWAGVTAKMEYYAKAPDKQMSVTSIDGYGQVKQGFDGKVAWVDNPESGLQELSGEMAEQAKRQAVFNAPLKWRELYPKAELRGKEKVGDRDAWVLILTSTAGKKVIQYVDAENFLMLRQTMTQQTPQGEMEVTADMSDYRDVSGVKVPFLIKQTLPPGDIIIKFTEMQNNVPIDDAQFAKPAK